jgi:hypothetical protein
MADVLFVAITIGFFVLCVLYVQLCDRIIGADDELDAATVADEREEVAA